MIRQRTRALEFKGRARGVLGLFLLLSACDGAQYDVILRNGLVVDGGGEPGVVADIAFLDGRIAIVGDLEGARAPLEINARGLFVAPAFIDTHSHAGPGLATEELSGAEPLLAQGIGTVFINPDGGGAVDLAQQRAALEEHGLGVNVAQFVPHGSIRRLVVGSEDREALPQELQRMRELVRAGMEAGGWGLSSGTFYAPGSYAPNSELVELAREAARGGGFYSSHIRDESNYTIGLQASIEEVIQVAREARIVSVVTHIKALGPPVWGESARVVERILEAREAGLPIYADQYPYLASSTGLSAALLPRWAQAGGLERLAQRMDDPDTLALIRRAVVNNLARRGGASRIQFRSYGPDPSIEGKRLSEIAAERRMDPLDVALEIIRGGSASIISFNMSETDVGRFMMQEWTMTASDGDLPRMGAGVPHPRAYGAFARKIGKYVFEDRAVTLEAAVRSMTGLPREVTGMRERGLIAEGLVADIVVFSPDFSDAATFLEPHQLSQGVVHLFLAGEAAIRDGEFTGAKAGKVLAKGAS